MTNNNMTSPFAAYFTNKLQEDKAYGEPKEEKMEKQVSPFAAYFQHKLQEDKERR